MKEYTVSDFDDSSIVEHKRRWEKLDSKVKGSIAESYVKTRLAELGFDVWVPYMNNHKTDLGVMIDGRLIRIQVKAATYAIRSKRFRCTLMTKDRHRKHIDYTPGELDVFIVYCPHVHVFYVIPATIGTAHHAVSMLPHRIKAINAHPSIDWEVYRERFDLIGSGNV